MKRLVYLFTQFLKILSARRFLAFAEHTEGETSNLDTPGTIVLIHRNELFYLVVHLFFVLLLRQQGYRTLLVVDDGYLTLQDNVRSPHLLKRVPRRMTFFRRLKIYLREHIYGWALTRKWRQTFLYFSEINLKINEAEIQDNIKKAKEGKLTKNVEASHKRLFGGRPFDSTNPSHLRYLEMNLRNEAINLIVARHIVEKIKPQLAILLDGTYTFAGTFLDYFTSRGVKCMIYQPNGFNDRHIYIGEKPFSINNVSSHWNNFIKNEYNEHYQKLGAKFLEERTEKNFVISPRILNLINQKKLLYQRTLGVFPNLTWDGAIQERNTLFESLEDWLIFTIEKSKESQSLLIFREHPQSPRHYSESESTISLVRDIKSEYLSWENIIWIDALDPTSTYSLIRNHVDLALVYNGTLVVETPYLGKPVMICGNSPYSGKGVGLEPKSLEEFCQILSGPSPKMKEVYRTNAIKAAAYQFHYNSYYLPLMPTVKDFNSREFNKYWKSWDTDPNLLNPRTNPQLQRTIQRFTQLS